MEQMPRSACAPLIAATLVVVSSWPTWAGESDLSATVVGTPFVSQGESATFTIRYANAGPHEAETPYVNVAIPSGLPAPLDQLTAGQFNALLDSATGTDTLGNSPMLFIDDASCENLILQLQGPVPPGPVEGLTPGGEGSFTFDLEIPMEPPTFGKMVIVEPAHMAREYFPALTRQRMYYPDGGPRYAPGLSCNDIVGGCFELGDCFGPRLSLMEPLTADLEIADDGGGSGDPALACDPLTGFTAGRIALIRRGECPYFDKAHHAQEAGAAGVVVVNDGRCTGLGADSPECVVPMPGGDDAGAIDIPVIMLSMTDGEDLMTAIENGASITVAIGAIPGGSFELSAFIFTTDVGEVDPVPGNDGHSLVVVAALFADGLESGDLSRWSDATP